MKNLTAPELKEIALDIEVELKQLARLREEIEKVNAGSATLNRGHSKLAQHHQKMDRINKIYKIM